MYRTSKINKGFRGINNEGFRGIDTNSRKQMGPIE
jgi:hypothetical protein